MFSPRKKIERPEQAPPLLAKLHSTQECSRHVSARAMAIAAHGMRGPGHALPYKHAMEERFGIELGNIRAYTDVQAQTSCAQLCARAYTINDRVAFTSPTPDSSTVAHEVTHILQTRAAQERTKCASEEAVERQASAAESGRTIAPLAASPNTVRLSSGQMCSQVSLEHVALFNNWLESELERLRRDYDIYRNLYGETMFPLAPMMVESWLLSLQRAMTTDGDVPEEVIQSISQVRSSVYNSIFQSDESLPMHLQQTDIARIREFSWEVFAIVSPESIGAWQDHLIALREEEIWQRNRTVQEAQVPLERLGEILQGEYDEMNDVFDIWTTRGFSLVRSSERWRDWREIVGDAYETASSEIERLIAIEEAARREAAERRAFWISLGITATVTFALPVAGFRLGQFVQRLGLRHPSVSRVSSAVAEGGLARSIADGVEDMIQHSAQGAISFYAPRALARFEDITHNGLALGASPSLFRRTLRELTPRDEDYSESVDFVREFVEFKRTLRRTGETLREGASSFPCPLVDAVRFNRLAVAVSSSPVLLTRARMHRDLMERLVEALDVSPVLRAPPMLATIENGEPRLVRLMFAGLTRDLLLAYRPSAYQCDHNFGRMECYERMLPYTSDFIRAAYASLAGLGAIAPRGDPSSETWWPLSTRPLEFTLRLQEWADEVDTDRLHLQSL